MLIWYFSNNLDIYDYVGKLSEQHFSVWMFSNPGDKILFLLKFDEARISEWNLGFLGGQLKRVTLYVLRAAFYNLVMFFLLQLIFS